MKNLDFHRNYIDQIDDEILKLLNSRMEHVKAIGELKNSSNLAIYRPEREHAILRRLEKNNDGMLSNDMIKAIFTQIFSVSRNLEMPQKVATLGPLGSYSHQAAKTCFGLSSQYSFASSIEEVFKSLHVGEAKYAVVPIENNTEGAVGVTLDCLGEYHKLKIVGEIYQEIHHVLASNVQDLSHIKQIYSHPQAYNQCRLFLRDHGLLDVAFIPAKSTADAAKIASKEQNSAAICSSVAANIYEVPIMLKSIEDNKQNRTRFLVISDFKNAKSGHDKTSILARTNHRPGELATLLDAFKSAGINLTKIESRPIKSSQFESNFYIDFQGHMDDEKVQSILLNPEFNITILGSYVQESF